MQALKPKNIHCHEDHGHSEVTENRLQKDTANNQGIPESQPNKCSEKQVNTGES